MPLPFGVRKKTAQAQASGYFEGEIVPVSIPQRKKGFRCGFRG